SVESATVREGCWESDRTSPSRSRRRSLTMRTVGPGCWRFDLGRVCGCDPTIVSAPCVSMTNPDGTRELEQLESRQTCEVLNDHTAASTRGPPQRGVVLCHIFPVSARRVRYVTVSGNSIITVHYRFVLG